MSRFFENLVVTALVLFALWQFWIVKALASLVALFGLTVMVGGW